MVCLLFLTIPLQVGLLTSSAQAQTDCAAQGDIPQVECEALVALFNSTNGPGWGDNTGWNQDNAPCSWLGVVCGAGNVTSLSLPFNDLSGPIPSEIGNLTSLTLQLNLRSNQLSGPIPPEIGNLTNVGMLNLLGNQLSGPIPPELGNLTSLTIIALAFNQLSGPIPPELGNLSGLVTLNLSGNQLSGPVPLSVATDAAGTTGFCSLQNNDPSLCMADTPDFQALAVEGMICGLPLTSSCGAGPPPITWTLSNVTFTDGGTATGKFEVDFDSDTITAWSVSMSGGDEVTYPPFTYSPGSSLSFFTPIFDAGTGSFVKFEDPNSDNPFGRPRELRLIPIAPLTAAAGTVAIDIDNGFGAECYACAPFRAFASGELVGAASPPPSADLVLEKTDSFDPVVQGQTFRYTLTVTNNGFNNAEGVVITETLPAGITLVSTSGCAEDPGGAPTCSLGSLTAGTSRSVQIEVLVDGATLGQITNDATVTSLTTEASPGDEAASETTDVVVPPNSDLRLEKTASAAELASGSDLEFDLSVTNDGPDSAVGITVTDTLPAGLTFVSASNGTADSSEADGTVTCTIAQLAATSSATITISTMIDATTQGQLLNMATVATNGNDPNAANDSSEAAVTVFLPGDLNRDGLVDALDVSALVQELNDDDGEAVADVATGTFPGTADFDLNGDDLITIADIEVLAELIFDPPDLSEPEASARERLIGLSPQGGAAGSVLDFPRLAVEAGNLTGMAIANPGAQDAALTFRAYGENGALLAEDSNRNVPGGQQLSLLTSELFPGLPAGTVAWFQATSPVSGLSGFFLELNFATFAELDGADLPPRARRIVFNTVQTSDGASTELNVVNPGNATANVTLTLISGEDRVERDIQLPAKGVARMDAATLFGLNDEAPAGANDSSRYILAEANQDLLGFEFIRAADGDLQGLNARSALELLNRIYIPQLAVLGIIESELGLVNYSAQRVIATITAHKTGGDLFGAGEVLTNPVTIALGPGESIRQDVATMFGFQGGDTVQGWLEIESSQAINGFLAYRVPVTGAAAAVSAVAQGTTTAIFSHLATVGDFYTGVAALNPSSYPVNLRIIALSVTGEVLGTFDTVLAPGQRLSDLISNMIPGADDRGGGLILMRTNYPSIFVSLFGTFNGKTFANIPPPSRLLASIRPMRGCPRPG